ncbi:MAG: carbohydrate ABC transporter permease [Gammaproteobacteria bacterium]|jgi:multiple sugar transport system permease protein|uniref:carbohydrate ABC transporter permease n=1 Tax=Marinomonas TaxID=28253 RepID=UPI000C1E760F|nr:MULTISPECIES: carbohydrate ABC transporter permease [unclassified Marinomonas]MBU1293405.1 carbohydrate ABC transporter permease [Gammaproteobacteria bacterium]MBU1464973.1 carbohydrate ABC transporter permease [Gammaproteobacteria bacterium]MBU2023365.1 carbohydrate ABC transporter permease [Gammaproteobacteria bacterium]MBU2237884.1 carbohydrate ABC transporter permease [Gammaproteobacteria bacterium]MBU2318627.1 carbohydrate ABC transporter permease [Gammaproteobacteria bacterium]|tara:strand:+ start:582 stop:1433 length:852 start_codon:yes stop_codon:yes gene_type:complete
MFPTPIEKRSLPFNLSYRVAVWIALFLWLLPLIAVMMTSARSMADINGGNYWGIPTEWMFFENYTMVFTQTPMLRYLLNSLIITLPAVFGAVALSTLAGYALAKYKFRGNVALFAAFIAGNFVPFQILMIPVRDLTISMGLYDTASGLILFHIAFQTGFCTLFMRNFIVGLPDELIEAARVEGVSEWQIFWHVVLPLVRPALAALSVLIFTFIWNDYFWALVLVQSDEVRPITAGISALKGQWMASWQLIAAGSIVAALPPVILFFAMQRHFIAGLTLGATKG